jgi:hypothetical protein
VIILERKLNEILGFDYDSLAAQLATIILSSKVKDRFSAKAALTGC